MSEYHKIQSVFKRDPENRHKTFLEGQYTTEAFEYLKDCQWEFTEKVDGMNIRVTHDGVSRRFGGKSENAQIPAPLIERLEELFPNEKLEEVFKDLSGDAIAVLYGEGYGGKIQKAGSTYGPEQRFVLFDVKVGDFWLRTNDVLDVAFKLDLQCVPLFRQGTLPEMVEMCREGFDSKWGDFPAEGIVARPLTPLVDRRGHRVITKCKLKDFPR